MLHSLMPRSHRRSRATHFSLAGTTRPLTGREVARLSRRGTPAAIAAALNRLVDQGLVLRDEVGGAFLHTLNRAHLAAPAVVVLAGLRIEVLERLVDSDIDLLIVRPAQIDGGDERWRTQLRRLAEDVRAWTGNHAGFIEVAEQELPGLQVTHPPALESLQHRSDPTGSLKDESQ